MHREHHAYYSIDAAYLYQTLDAIPMRALSITGIVGADLGDFAVGGILEGAPGRTEGGLDAFTYAMGALFEGHVDRLRLGGGVTFGVFNASRITTSDSLTTGTVGVFGRVTVDLLPIGDEGALYLVGKGSYDAAGGALLGLSAGVGIRY